MYLSCNWIRVITLICLLQVPYFLTRNYIGYDIAALLNIFCIFIIFALLPRTLLDKKFLVPKSIYIMLCAISILIFIETIGYYLGQRLGITIIRNLIYIFFTSLGGLILLSNNSRDKFHSNLIIFILIASVLVFNEILSKYIISKVPSSEIMYLSAISAFILIKYLWNEISSIFKIFFLLIFTLGPLLSGVAGSVLTLGSAIILSQERKYIYFMTASITLIALITYFYMANFLSYDINDLMKNYFVGFSSTDYISTIDIKEGNSQAGSSYIRNATNFLAFQEFLNNPIFGSGNSYVKNEIQISGYWTHTYFIYILASYGIVGFILVVIFIFKMLRLDKLPYKETLRLFLVISVMLLFTNELYLFLPVLSFCLYTSLTKKNT